MTPCQLVMGSTWTDTMMKAASSSETLETNHQSTVPPWTTLKVGGSKVLRNVRN